MFKWLKKVRRRVFGRKIKANRSERFELYLQNAVKVTPEWIFRNGRNLVEIAAREDTITDATIVLYRDRRGGVLSCEYQHSGKQVKR